MSTRTALILVALITAFALVGCGFTPVYGTHANGGAGSPVASALDSVYIDTIPNRTGQKLRNLLMDRFYATGQKHLADSRYRLQMDTIGESIYGLGIAKDATATRSQIKLTTSFTLTDNQTGEALMSRTLSAVSSFNTLASQYTTLVTEEDARDTTIHDLAEQVTTMIELYFSSPAAFPSSQAQLHAGPAVETVGEKLRKEHNSGTDYNTP